MKHSVIYEPHDGMEHSIFSSPTLLPQGSRLRVSLKREGELHFGSTSEYLAIYLHLIEKQKYCVYAWFNFTCNPWDKSSPSGLEVGNCLKWSCPEGSGGGGVGENDEIIIFSLFSEVCVISCAVYTMAADSKTTYENMSFCSL